MTIYTPHKWVILEITQHNEKTHRVLGSWYGGYLGSDSWRLSSGITGISLEKDSYVITNHSGSKYICHKDNKGMSTYTASVLESMKLASDKIKIEVLEKIPLTLIS